MALTIHPSNGRRWEHIRSSYATHSMSLTVEKRSYVPPVSPSTPVGEGSTTVPNVELAGVDVMFNGMNVRVAIYFNDVVSKQVLKDSLAKVLPGFPLLNTRVIKETTRAYCPLDDKGPKVYEQHLTITDAPTTDPLTPYISKLVRGKERSGSGDPNMILTLTEVDYRESMTFQCRPPAACRYEDGSATDKVEGSNPGVQRPRFVIGVW